MPFELHAPSVGPDGGGGGVGALKPLRPMLHQLSRIFETGRQRKQSSKQLQPSKQPRQQHEQQQLPQNSALHMQFTDVEQLTSKNQRQPAGRKSSQPFLDAVIPCGTLYLDYSSFSETTATPDALEPACNQEVISDVGPNKNHNNDGINSDNSPTVRQKLVVDHPPAMRRCVSFAALDSESDDSDTNDCETESGYSSMVPSTASSSSRPSSSLRASPYKKGILKVTSRVDSDENNLLEFCLTPPGKSEYVSTGTETIDLKQWVTIESLLDRISVVARVWVADPKHLDVETDEDDTSVTVTMMISRSTTTFSTVVRLLELKAQPLLHGSQCFVRRIRVQNKAKQWCELSIHNEIDWRLRVGEACGQEKLFMFVEVGLC
ncbi:hypothetical protein HDU82_001960 [Entophlyctis luteolus]|nr:hypothetical protein HDU82_001960 [Entophlyctis luteolus]